LSIGNGAAAGAWRGVNAARAKRRFERATTNRAHVARRRACTAAAAAAAKVERVRGNSTASPTKTVV